MLPIMMVTVYKVNQQSFYHFPIFTMNSRFNDFEGVPRLEFHVIFQIFPSPASPVFVCKNIQNEVKKISESLAIANNIFNSHNMLYMNRVENTKSMDDWSCHPNSLEMMMTHLFGGPIEADYNLIFQKAMSSIQTSNVYEGTLVNLPRKISVTIV